MSLASYKKKRAFSNTPEPEGKVNGSHKRLAFVVQKHKASHLHYDFRLELKGVLKSWAVPKGPSMNPKDKRLAMMTEDHPYEYRNFEGTIPKGNYGAGEVIIWDNGYYEPRSPTDKPEHQLMSDLFKGRVSFILHGRKLKGEFTLVKDSKAGENAWLLIKKNDEYATAQDITAKDRSVVSNKRIPESTRKTALEVDVSMLSKGIAPENVKPMLATLAETPFDDDGWMFEVKWDGYRAIAEKHGGVLKLYSRRGQNFTNKYMPVTEELKNIDEEFVIDGEIVAVDEEGKARFEWLQSWGRAPKGTLEYIVFDILWYNGHKLDSLGLKERKIVLKELVSSSKSKRIKFSDHVTGRGKDLFKLAKEKDLEGIMAKRSSSSYQAGRRSKDWLKMKTHLRQEAVIGGFTEPRGSRKHIGALILGVYEGNKLTYVGHTGGGIPPDQMEDLKKTLQSMELDKSPFAESVKPNAPVHWTEPKLVCEVTFSEWTSGGNMRHPIFAGLREDKPAKNVMREIPDANVAGNTEVRKEGDRMHFTHEDKVFWPKSGITKGDLLHYYEAVAKTMLPYLKDRPHSLLRQPNGIEGQAFFQKDVDHTVPDWIKTKSVYSESNDKDIKYLVCDSKDSLLYMAQLGCIEINPWNSKVGSLDKPDWVAIDLDPEDISFDKVIETALAVHEVCREYSIDSYPKTSGKTGIHIYIPLAAKYNYDQTRQFGQLLAQIIHKKVPDITSLERSPKKRQKKVYLDYLQNRKGQTLAAPYSVRPMPDASVSAPLEWGEVRPGLNPSNFTIKNMLERLYKKGDLWKPVIGKGVDMNEILSKMS